MSVYEDPDDLGYFDFPIKPLRSTPSTDTSVPPGATKREWICMEIAAFAEHRGSVDTAESFRKRSGYGGLT